MKNLFHPIVLTLIVFGTVVSTSTFVLQLKETRRLYEEAPSESLTSSGGWTTFQNVIANNNGTYSFAYPDSYSVAVDKTTSEHRLTIFASSNDQIPAMTIAITNTMDDASVTFSLWEGYAWEYYDEVIASFEISN